MKTILILEPSTSGLNLLPSAHALGLRTIVLTANGDERIIPDNYKRYIFKEFYVDTNDIQALIPLTQEIHQQYSLSAIIPGFEIFVAHAAQLSQLIGVPGLSSQTGHILRQKPLMREMLAKHNLRSPRYYVATSLENLQSQMRSLSFPCVIKPIDQSGSMHVSRVDSSQELLAAYQRMCNDTWTEMGKGIGTQALIEEYVAGSEVSVEGFVQDGIPTLLSITQKIVGPEPFFVEMGHIVQANLPIDTKHAIENYVKNILHAIHFTIGVFHCELKISPEGPVLIEIAGRLAGDKIPDLILLASNINLYEIMLQVHLGNKINLNANHQVHQYAAIQFFAPSQSYQRIIGIEALQAQETFQVFKVLIDAHHPIPPLENFLGRVAYCIQRAPSYEELVRAMTFAEQTIQFL